MSSHIGFVPGRRSGREQSTAARRSFETIAHRGSSIRMALVSMGRLLRLPRRAASTRAIPRAILLRARVSTPVTTSWHSAMAARNTAARLLHVVMSQTTQVLIDFDRSNALHAYLLTLLFGVLEIMIWSFITPD